MSFRRSTILIYFLLLCITIGNMEQTEVNNGDDWPPPLQPEEVAKSPESTFITKLEETLNKDESKPEATKKKEYFLSNLLQSNKNDGTQNEAPKQSWLANLLNPNAGNKTESNKEPNSQATPNLGSWLLSLLSPPANADADTDKQSDGADTGTKTKQPWFMNILNLLNPKLPNATGTTPTGNTEPETSTDVKKPGINGLSWISDILQQVLKPSNKNEKQSDSMVKSLLSLVMTGQGTATDKKGKPPSKEKHLEIHEVKIPNLYVSRFNEYFSHEWTEATYGILGPVGLSGRLGGLFMLLTSGGFGMNTISGAGSETNIFGQILNSLTSGAFGGKGIIGDTPQIDVLLAIANKMTGGKIPKRFADA